MNSNDVRPFYYSQVRVDPRDPMRVYWSSTPVNFSNDGGKTVGNATQGIHVDHHAMWIDPNDPNHFIVGDDGGISISYAVFCLKKKKKNIQPITQHARLSIDPGFHSTTADTSSS